MKGLFQDIRLFKISEESQQRAETLCVPRKKSLFYFHTVCTPMNTGHPTNRNNHDGTYASDTVTVHITAI